MKTIPITINVLAGLLLQFALAACTAEKPGPPNFVVIIADAWSTDKPWRTSNQPDPALSRHSKEDSRTNYGSVS